MQVAIIRYRLQISGFQDAFPQAASHSLIGAKKYARALVALLGQ
jgi:hypothetical protein